MTKRYYYYVVLGSNIDAAHNIGRALEAVGAAFKKLIVHPRVVTHPWNVEGKSNFINTAIEFASSHTTREVKTILKNIEERLGRPKALIDRKTKDRTCDLDIVAALETQLNDVWSHQSEYFIQAIFDPKSEYTEIILQNRVIRGDVVLELNASTQSPQNFNIRLLND